MVRTEHRQQEPARPLLLKPLPRLRTPRNHPRRTHPERPLDALGNTNQKRASNESATHHHRQPRLKHKPHQMGQLRRSEKLNHRQRARIRTRQRHRMHRPRPLPYRWATHRSRSNVHLELPQPLHRDLTIRRRTPHMGHRRRTTRQRQNHQRTQRRTVQSRPIHHRHGQAIPARQTPSAVTLFPTTADLSDQASRESSSSNQQQFNPQNGPRGQEERKLGDP